MRLVDLRARWVNDHDAPPDAKQGVSFECPCCVGSGRRLAVFFANPITSHPPAGVSQADWVKRAEANHLTDHRIGAILWQRTGETFATLSLMPSVDCSKWGHWHGTITNGVCSGGAVRTMPPVDGGGSPPSFG